jgi:hypothetical protein
LQSWYTHLGLNDHNKSPYFLYALSNAASVMPFFLEPAFRLKVQSWIWGGGFAAFIVSQLALCAWWMRRSHAEKGILSRKIYCVHRTATSI